MAHAVGKRQIFRRLTKAFRRVQMHKLNNELGTIFNTNQGKFANGAKKTLFRSDFCSAIQPLPSA